MKYETTPVKASPIIRRKAMAKLTTDINKLSTMRILMHLYKRHETDILTVFCAVEFALLIVWKM